MPEVGEVLEGKVSGITKFGAFISLPGGQKGLVHISELANTFVREVSDVVELGQTVRVKVLSTADGKISLSIKKVEAEPPRPRRVEKPAAPMTESEIFEDKLKKFMQESDSRIAGNPMYADRNKSRRKR